MSAKSDTLDIFRADYSSLLIQMKIQSILFLTNVRFFPSKNTPDTSNPIPRRKEQVITLPVLMIQQVFQCISNPVFSSQAELKTQIKIFFTTQLFLCDLELAIFLSAMFVFS